MIGHLSARFGVERCLAQEERDAVFVQAPNGSHLRLDLDGVVADERDFARLHAAGELPLGQVAKNVRLHTHLLRLAFVLRPPALRVQRRLEARDVHDVAALTRHELGEVDGESERVVEAERVFAADGAAQVRAAIRGLQWSQLLESRETAFDRGKEALLFGQCRDEQMLAALPELRVHVSERVDHGLHDVDQRRFAPAEQPGVPNGATQDASQHVSTPFV